MQLSEQRLWQVLLHYKPRYFGGVKSDADHEAFFLAKNGKTSEFQKAEAMLDWSELSALERRFFEKQARSRRCPYRRRQQEPPLFRKDGVRYAARPDQMWSHQQ